MSALRIRSTPSTASLFQQGVGEFAQYMRQVGSDGALCRVVLDAHVYGIGQRDDLSLEKPR